MKGIFKRCRSGFALVRVMLIVAFVALLAALVTARAANVELKYSGPSGQGDLIWYSPAFGVTNMVMGTNGVRGLNFAPGEALTNSTLSLERTVVTGTVTVTKQTGVFFDATGAAFTNAAGVAMPVVTNVTATVTIHNGTLVVTNATLSD